jgi:hypothetical protein
MKQIQFKGIPLSDKSLQPNLNFKQAIDSGETRRMFHRSQSPLVRLLKIIIFLNSHKSNLKVAYKEPKVQKVFVNQKRS